MFFRNFPKLLNFRNFICLKVLPLINFGNMSIIRLCRDYYWRSKFWELPFRSHSTATISQLIDPVRAYKQP
jgi:hypothetical protein